MRLNLMRSSLPLALFATMMCAQQAKPSSATPTAQPIAVKDSATQSVHAKTVHHTHHRRARRRQASSRKGAKRVAYRPEYTQNSVEVMNGSSTQKVVFQNGDAARTSQKGNADPGYKVDVLNGTAQDTQYFNGATSQTGSDDKHPVVVAVQSSDTRVVGGNKHAVVTAITAAGPVDAKSAAGGGQKVTTAVSPQPKRPAYQPDAH